MTMDAYKLYWLTKSCSNILKFMAESTIRIPPTIQIGPTYIHLFVTRLTCATIHSCGPLIPPSIPSIQSLASARPLWIFCLFSLEFNAASSCFTSTKTKLVVLLLLRRFCSVFLELRMLPRRVFCSQSVLPRCVASSVAVGLKEEEQEYGGGLLIHWSFIFSPTETTKKIIAQRDKKPNQVQEWKKCLNEHSFVRPTLICLLWTAFVRAAPSIAEHGLIINMR